MRDSKLALLFNFEGSSETPEDARGCSSDGRAPALQAGGRGFESLHLHQTRKG